MPRKHYLHKSVDPIVIQERLKVLNLLLDDLLSKNLEIQPETLNFLEVPGLIQHLMTQIKSPAPSLPTGSGEILDPLDAQFESNWNADETKNVDLTENCPSDCEESSSDGERTPPQDFHDLPVRIVHSPDSSPAFAITKEVS